MVDDAAGRRTNARRWSRIGALLALAYAVGVLVLATRSGTAGFVSIYGGPVLAVETGSAAEAAGVRAGDVVLAVNGATTLTPLARDRLLHRLRPGQELHLRVLRDGKPLELAYTIPRRLPLGSAAGSALAAALLLLALLSDRGGPRSPTRSFIRSSIVYVVFLAGTFAWDTLLGHPIIAVPWIVALCLAAPVTCHFMFLFPAGVAALPRRTLLWIYGPPLAIAASHLIVIALFVAGMIQTSAPEAARWGGMATAASAAIYLTIGAIERGRRLRRKRGEVDPVAIRFLHIGGVAMSAPLIIGTLLAIRDPGSFIGGGFAPYVATAMVGGSICVVIALARTQFGDIDRILRRGTGQLVGAAVAAAVYLGVVTVLGTSALARVGSVTAAVAATVLAAVVFGPLRSRVQALIDERFAEGRARARALIRDAAEMALRTLDVDALQSGVVLRVRNALGANGVALVEQVPRGGGAAGLRLAGGDGEQPSPVEGGGWRLVAEVGSVSIGAELPSRDPVAIRLDEALGNGPVSEISGSGSIRAGVIAAPIRMGTPPPAALVVAPAPDRPLDDEDREMLATLAAGLAVALANARAHTELRDMSRRLEDEVAVAERRRREIARLKERIEEEKQVIEAELARRGGRAPVIGAGLRPIFETVQKVARSEVTVLVSGETGVGKELFARAVHVGSPRRGGPFVVVDCASIPAGLFESALFGHERGAFTGATRAAQGAFRAAHGGTIFLDEIGELPLDLQPKLLRVLQEREVRPVGAEGTLPVDVRVVAGTNRDLSAEVELGHFREDLLYRLRVVEITVPPLRARRRDIPELAESFLAAIAERRGHPPKRLTPAAVTALLDYDWPGNVRELEHALEAAAVATDGEEILPSHLRIQDEMFRRRAEHAVAHAGSSGPGLRETLETLERDRLLETLRHHQGNRSAAAKSLGLSRGALLRRLARYSIGDRIYPSNPPVPRRNSA